MRTNINSDERQNITFHGWLFTGVIHYFVEDAINDNFTCDLELNYRHTQLKWDKNNKKKFFVDTMKLVNVPIYRKSQTFS